jgi:prevent-host-death family protein
LVEQRIRNAKVGGSTPLIGTIDSKWMLHGLPEDLYWSIFSLSRRFLVRFSSQVKPISYLKANAAEVLAELGEKREPLVITQNGEAKAVLQDVASFEATQETLALLKLIALGNGEVQSNQVRPVREALTRLRSRAPRS